MADLHIPGIGIVILDTGKMYHLPNGVIIESTAIMNQLQGPNVGADLYNGTIQ